MTSIKPLLRRKIVEWTLAYLAASWVLAQVVEMIGDGFGWPAIVQKVLLIVLGFGFLAALVVAWYHGERGAQRVSVAEGVLLLIIMLAAGSTVAFVARGSEEATSPAPDPGAAELASIAVLPFADMSATRDQRYFSDGISEQLLDALSKVAHLRVAARTSSFGFRETTEAAQEIGRKLGVAHLLEGSVRKDGNVVRITAQLIDAATGYHVWSETYDRELSSIFAVQDEISRAIVDKLKVALGGATTRAPTQNMHAYELYLRGREALGPRTPLSFKQAVAFFEEAIDADSLYVDAISGLASAYALMAYYRVVPPDAFKQARTLAQRALALDNTASAPHISLAYVSLWYDYDFPAARKHFEEGFAISRSDAPALVIYALMLRELGRMDEAVAVMRETVRRDPLVPFAHRNLGLILVQAGHTEAGLAALRYAMELAPNDPHNFSNLGLTYASLDRPGDAAAAFAKSVSILKHEHLMRGNLALMLRQSGLADSARVIAKQVFEAREQEYVPATALASAALALDDKDAAMAYLELAFAERDPFMAYVKESPFWRPLYGTSRYQALLRKIKYE